METSKELYLRRDFSALPRKQVYKKTIFFEHKSDFQEILVGQRNWRKLDQTERGDMSQIRRGEIATKRSVA
jgi:hypothetical protein